MDSCYGESLCRVRLPLPVCILWGYKLITCRCCFCIWICWIYEYIEHTVLCEWNRMILRLLNIRSHMSSFVNVVPINIVAFGLMGKPASCVKNHLMKKPFLLFLFLSHSKSLTPVLSFALRGLRAGTAAAWVLAFLKHFWHQMKGSPWPPFWYFSAR